MLNDINKRINHDIEILKKVEEMARSFEYHYIINRCEGLFHRMKKLEFYVVVIGAFKRGKSTLLNYFMGKELLPTGVIPITSIITKLKYGDEPRANILFENGVREEIHIDLINQYIEEEKNPKNIKKVDHIEVFFPADLLKGGLVLIDTPGIGSAHKHNTEVAYNYLSEADAAIFLISSDAPVGQVELEFLDQVKKYIDKIFFIQNKVDYLSCAEREESMDFSRKMIANVIGKEPIIYPITAKLGLEGKKEKNEQKINESGMTIFEMALEDFLVKDQGVYLIQNFHNKIKSIIMELKGYVDFKLELLNSHIATIEEKINILREGLKDTEEMEGEALAIIESELENIIDSFAKEMVLFKEQQAEVIQDYIKLVAKENQEKSSKEFQQILNRHVEEKVENTLGQWNEKQEVKMKKSYEKVMTRFTDKLNEILEQINQQVYDLFKIKIAQPIEEFQLIHRDSFYFKFNSSSPPLLAPTINDLMFLLPKKQRNKRILSEALKGVKEELEKNGNNLKWDYTCKIRDSKYIFERAFREHIQEVKTEIGSVIEKIIKIKVEKTGEVEQEKAFYIEKRANLQELEKRLGSYLEKM